MRRGFVCSIAGLFVLPLFGQAQSEVKPKPPMYSYIANWEVPREKFKDMEAQIGGEAALMKKQLAAGNLVGFGNDTTLVHQPGQSTHDNWWSSMSLGGLMKVLEDLKSTSDAPVLASGKHDDKIYVSRYYNWRSGSFTNGYTRAADYKLKPGAPQDVIDNLAKNFIVPMMEKLLASGAIHEYEVDLELVHTRDPASFTVIYVANGPDGLDKAMAALREAQRSAAFFSGAAEAWMESSSHRDGLYHTTATYK